MLKKDSSGISIHGGTTGGTVRFMGAGKKGPAGRPTELWSGRSSTGVFSGVFSANRFEWFTD